MSTDRGTQTAITGFRNQQTSSDDLRCLEKPGDCRHCGGDVPSSVTRIAGDNEGRVPGCRRCLRPTNGVSFETHSNALAAFRRGRAVRGGGE